MSRKQMTLAGLRGILVAGVAVALVGCPPHQEPSGPAGSSSSPGAVSARTTIRQIGSTTLLALAEKWREGFNQEHPDAEIAVSGGGSGTGINAL
ncbi:MAG: phosphate ABC transporter substrate-binding protein, partial [Armatimonadetes bacterium]|nr:phosphate ABC transporter substrate-binding protein [Armatimonadota bacterium]